MNFLVKVFGDAETRTRFLVGAARTDAQTRTVVLHYGQLLATRVQANASGRPGPNAPTGDYRRSIHAEPHGSGAGFAVAVGTNKPQGRRLEFGFSGRDSLGRLFDQPPYPHFGPAVAVIEPQFVAALKAITETL